jgi:hypothetical protein
MMPYPNTLDDQRPTGLGTRQVAGSITGQLPQAVARASARRGGTPNAPEIDDERGPSNPSGGLLDGIDAAQAPIRGAAKAVAGAFALPFAAGLDAAGNAALTTLGYQPNDPDRFTRPTDQFMREGASAAVAPIKTALDANFKPVAPQPAGAPAAPSPLVTPPATGSPTQGQTDWPGRPGGVAAQDQGIATLPAGVTMTPGTGPLAGPGGRPGGTEYSGGVVRADAGAGATNVVPSTYSKDLANVDALVSGYVRGGDLERANALAVTGAQKGMVAAAYGQRNQQAAANARYDADAAERKDAAKVANDQVRTLTHIGGSNIYSRGERENAMRAAALYAGQVRDNQIPLGPRPAVGVDANRDAVAEAALAQGAENLAEQRDNAPAKAALLSGQVQSQAIAQNLASMGLADRKRLSDNLAALETETDPDKRTRLVDTILAAQGKSKAPKYSAIHAKGGSDPNNPLSTLPDQVYVIDETTGQARQVSLPAGGGAAKPATIPSEDDYLKLARADPRNKSFDDDYLRKQYRARYAQEK